MNCRELREYLFAFLDSELDASHSIEVQRHLEQCPECAREAEIERAIRRQLSLVLHGSHDGPAIAKERELDAIVARVHADEPNRVVLGRRRRRWPAAIFAVAVFGLVFVGSRMWMGGEVAHGSVQFVDHLIADFEQFQQKGRPLQITSSDPSELSIWLADQVELSVAVPTLDEKVGRLLGARKCRIDGRLAGLIAYELNGTLASLIVMAEADADIDNMARIEHEGHTHWVDRGKGHTVLACKRGDLVYAAVSTLPEDRLLALMINP